MKKSKCKYIDGGYNQGFTSDTDYKQIVICIGDKLGGSRELAGWLKVKICFDEYFDLTITDSERDLLIMEECDLGVLARLRDFLNYALIGNYEKKTKVNEK